LQDVELFRGLDEVAFAHDVVALEHRARLVSGHLHRDALRNAGAHQVAHGGPPQVVRNATRTTRLCARRSKRLDERRDPLALHFLVRPVEDPRADDVLGLQPVVLGLLSLQELLEGVGEREGAAFVVLRCMRVQTDDAASKSTCRH
jgi:hypothetical protein